MSDKYKSIDSSRPIECYKFTGPYGTYLYTDYIEPVTLGYETYYPNQIKRSAIDINAIIDNPITTDIILPGDDPLSKLYAFTTSPGYLNIEVYQAHHGDDWTTDYRRIWFGYDIEFSTGRDNLTTIKTGSLIQSDLTGPLQHVNYQRMCNHVLFDERCKVDRDLYKVMATITGIRGRYITVDDDGYPNGDLVRGTLTIFSTQEQRGIIGNIDNELLLGDRLIRAEIGDIVEIVRGCDHIRLSDCKQVFDNVVNYGGFDFIPAKNPFEQLNLNNNATITTTVRAGQFRPTIWSVSGG